MYIAVDIGGTKTLVALFDEDGNIVKQAQCETDQDYQVFLEHLCKTIDSVKLEDTKLSAMAIAAPGKIDYDKGIVSRFGNLPWKDVKFQDDLCLETDGIPVIVDNDANFGALGEAVVGAGAGHKKVLYLTLSTGIGSGVAVNGKLSQDFAQSEAGHMFLQKDGKLTMWEKFASGRAFLEKYGKMGSETDDQNIWDDYAKDVAVGLNPALAIVQPDIVVIGGSMGDYLEKFHQPLVKALKEIESPMIVRVPPIVEAKDAPKAVIYGCYVGAMNSAKDNK